jgi:hypothetical protein
MYKVYVSTGKNVVFQNLPNIASVKAFVTGLVDPYIDITSPNGGFILKFSGDTKFQVSTIETNINSRRLLKTFKKSSCQLPKPTVESTKVIPSLI